MTDVELMFLKSQIDKVGTLETIQGDHILAQILFVFDGEDTPDVFYLEVEPGPKGAYIQKGTNGYSTLLSDILSVKPPSLPNPGSD
ncbi:MAG TPA: hypothetical protein VFE22_07025 [Edaphobacter sp.]|jgi:hypothetical protein|nr:hypothetical protein [Edaphobacter sp.]